MHAVGADERRDRLVGEAGVDRGVEPGRVCGGEELGEHRAHVPVDVPVAALAVTPARAPGNAGDDDRRRAGARWRADLQERVVLRVVPVHARRERAALRHGDVDLEGRAGARRARGAEEPGAVRPRGLAHHTRGQVQEARELRQVELRRFDLGRAGEHRNSRRRRGGQLTRQLHARQRLGVALVEPRQPLDLVRDEVLQDAWVAERLVPVAPGLVRGQPVQRLRRRLHAATLRMSGAWPVAPGEATAAAQAATASGIAHRERLRPATSTDRARALRRSGHCCVTVSLRGGMDLLQTVQRGNAVRVDERGQWQRRWHWHQMRRRRCGRLAARATDRLRRSS